MLALFALMGLASELAAQSIVSAPRSCRFDPCRKPVVCAHTGTLEWLLYARQTVLICCGSGMCVAVRMCVYHMCRSSSGRGGQLGGACSQGTRLVQIALCICLSSV